MFSFRIRLFLLPFGRTQPSIISHRCFKHRSRLYWPSHLVLLDLKCGKREHTYPKVTLGDTKLLKVACTGDSRAVLGRRRSGSAGDWEAIALSEDQTGNNENETRRLHSEHPNEPEMIKDGRLLGLVVTRAFGDSRWKWPRELQEQARDRFFGPQLREGCQTPPYLTAEPVVTTTRIKPENGDFLIQASDGLWDEISSAQAVDLVGRWLKNHDPSKEATPLDLSDVLTPPKTEKRVNPAGKRSYQSLGRVQERDYVVRDENAAVHLARNALGGRDEDRLRGE